MSAGPTNGRGDLPTPGRPPDGRGGRGAAMRYGAALLAVAVTAGVTWAAQPLIAPTVLPPFIAAVALTAWWGGLGPSLLASALSLLVINVVFFSDPPGTLALNQQDLPRLVVFVLVALIISGISAAQQRTEAALRASEHRFRTMVEVANEGVVLVDPDGTIAYANDRFAHLVGATADVTGTPIWQYLFPEDLPEARDLLRRALADRLDQFAFRLRQPDGGEVPVLIASSPVGDEAAGLSGVLALLTDVGEWQQTARDLERAHERFRLAAEAVDAMIYDWDPQTGRVERSRGLLPLVGWRPEEVPSTNDWWTEQIHPDDRSEILRRGRPSQSADDRYSVEYRVRHRDGHWVTVWDQGQVVRDAAGRVTRVVGSTMDISPRKQVEAALQLLADAAEILSSGLDVEAVLERVASLPVPTLADWCAVDIVGADGVLRRGASALRDGPPPAALPGLDLSRATIRQGVPLLAARSGVAVEGVTTGPEASAALDETSATTLLSLPLRARGACFGAMTLLCLGDGAALGEREVRLARELARRSALAIDNARLYHDVQEAEARYRGLFEGATDGILVINRTGRFVDANPAVVSLLGHAREDLLRMSVTDLEPLGRSWSSAEFAQLRQDGAWRGEIDFQAKDGRSVPVEAWVDAVRLPGGVVYVAVLRDISERRAFAQMQEEFVSAVAHDLRNPLAAIRGQAQLLRRRLRKGEMPAPDRLEQGVVGIDAGAARMADLIDELVDAARVRSGKALDLRRSRVDLVGLARQTAETYQRTTDRHVIRVGAASPEVVGSWDGSRLERVLGNLIGNAIKYSPDGGTITVRVGREAGNGTAPPMATVAVADTGVGIPAADLPRVFERFHRGANVASISGTGLGLAGARQIVEEHGGTIAVESREGVGSTFTVRLPMDDCAPDVPAADVERSSANTSAG